jgi:hypothetical protein
MYQESIKKELQNIVDLGQANAKLVPGLVSNQLDKPITVKVTEEEQAENRAAFGFNFSNDQRTFPTGAQRDSSSGKPRPDLISPFATMRRGRVMELGAKKYGYRNWEKGMPLSVFMASAMRHLTQFSMGAKDEDHLAHCAFNLDAIMHGQEMIKRGLWPKEFDDLPTYE